MSFKIDHRSAEFQTPTDINPEVAIKALETMKDIASIYSNKPEELSRFGDKWRLNKSGIWERIDDEY